jgi:hypothetical protein
MAISPVLARYLHLTVYLHFILVGLPTSHLPQNFLYLPHNLPGLPTSYLPENLLLLRHANAAQANPTWNTDLQLQLQRHGPGYRFRQKGSKMHFKIAAKKAPKFHKSP